MELTITKEKVLEAASKCDTAKATLQVLFPEVFSNDINEESFRTIDIKEHGWFLYHDDIGIMSLDRTKDGRVCFFLRSDFEWEIDKKNNFLIPTNKR